jgi:cytochrome c biogenesis protein CcmG/thiol:disulfide interchange protein DsbE
MVVALGCAASPAPRSESSPLLGDVMPPFESKTLNGNPFYSTAFHGNAFVVIFVKSGCAACERTLSAAQATYVDLRDVVVVGVFGADDAEAAPGIASRLAVKFPVVVDENGSIARQFRISELPKTFVVDGNGRVTWVGGSDLSEGTLSRAVRAVN